MKICFSLTNMELGGAQIFTIRLANELALTTDNTIYIYDHWPEYRNKNILTNLSPRVKIVSYTESKNERWFIWKLNTLFKKLGITKTYRYELNKNRFRKFILRNKINIVNSHQSYSDFVIAEANLPASCKFISTLHGEYELMLKEGDPVFYKNKIDNALPKMASLIYTADKNLLPVKELVSTIKLPAKKISVGFSEKMFSLKTISRQSLGYSEDDFIVGMIGRGIREKGWDTAISVIRSYNSGTSSPVKLLLIGDGDYLKNLVNDTKDPNIQLLQFGENFQDYFSCYQLFNLFLFPSRFPGESVPNVIIECLYWKIPVLASHTAEIPGMIQAGTNHAAGICVSVDAHPEGEFLKAFREIMAHKEQLKIYSDAAEQAFTKFSMPYVSRQYLDIFRSCLSEKEYQ